MSNKEQTAVDRARAFMGKPPVNDDAGSPVEVVSEKQVAIRERVLETAAQLIMSDRNKAYGPPAESFEKIAMIITILTGKQVTREDVALFNIAQKMVRNSYVVKEDNSVDLVGYGAILRELEVSPQSQMYSAVMELVNHKG